MRRDDSGKVTIFITAMFLWVWIPMLEVVVIGGAHLRAHQRADNIAAEAARAAGSEIQTGVAVPGGPKVIDAGKASEAATTYLGAAGASGTVSVSPDGTHLTVNAVVTYNNPTGINVIGGGTWTARGVATATLLVG